MQHSDYAWIVDSTMAPDPNDDEKLIEETGEDSRNGVTGPHNAPPDLLARLEAGEGVKWRTLYDVDYEGHPEEQRIVHVGRYLDTGDDADGESEFGPLWDLSEPDCGAAEVQYQQEDGTWKTL